MTATFSPLPSARELTTAVFAGILLAVMAASTEAAEGYSSTAPGEPAQLYYRAFTLYAGFEGCDTLPQATQLRLTLPHATMQVGDRLHFINQDSSRVSELIIEAYDAAGNFIPAVPLTVGVGIAGKGALTVEASDSIRSNAAVDYWEVTAPGPAAVGASVFCRYAEYKPVQAVAEITVLDPAAQPLREQILRNDQLLARAIKEVDLYSFEYFLCDDASSAGFTESLQGKDVVTKAWNRMYFQTTEPLFSWAMPTVEIAASGASAITGSTLLSPQGAAIGTMTTQWRQETPQRWCVASLSR